MEHINFLSATEAAAVAASQWIGRGNEREADQAAVTAMRHALNELDIQGVVVIGEGERDEAPMLYIGEEVGRPRGKHPVDIALDPLEGTTICARGDRGSLSVMAVGGKNCFLHAPDVYMDKIAVGREARNAINIKKSLEENVRNVADALQKNVDELRVIILDRPRHEERIQKLRFLGCRVILIGDGDVAAALSTAIETSGVDLMMGIGGAPEGVLASAALKCLGGNIQGILHFKTEEQKERARKMGVKDFNKVYSMEEMTGGDDVVFCATGVTSGDLLQGVELKDDNIITHSLFMRSGTGAMSHVVMKYPRERFFKNG